jgi:hypothetical protein
MKCRLLSLRLIIWRGVVRLGAPFDPAAARNGSIWSADWPRAGLPGITTLCRAISGCVGAQLPPVNRILRIVRLVSIATAPRALVRWLIGFRFVPSQRPARFQPVFIKVLSFATSYPDRPPLGKLSRSISGVLHLTWPDRPASQDFVSLPRRKHATAMASVKRPS